MEKGIFKTIRDTKCITFECNGSAFTRRIRGVRYYDNFHDLLRNEGLRNVLPYSDIMNVREGVQLYENIYYTKHPENKQYNICAIEVE